MKWKTRSTCTVTRNRWEVPAAKHGWFASDLPPLPVCKMHQCAMPKQINPRKSRLSMLRYRNLLRLLNLFVIRFFIHRSTSRLTLEWPWTCLSLTVLPLIARFQGDKTAIDLSRLRDRLADNRSKWYISLASFLRMIKSIHRKIKPRTIIYVFTCMCWFWHIFSIINFPEYYFFKYKEYLYALLPFFSLTW